MLVLYGPTATGKTALAIKLAKKLSGEIISADSRQIYKGLDIGTGKFTPNAATKKGKGWRTIDGVRVYGYDLKKPGENFSVVDFIDYATATAAKIRRNKRIPIMVGGTGFYIHSFITKRVFPTSPPDFDLREKLEKYSAFELLLKLMSLNKKRALNLNESDRKNPRRLVRAIELELNKSSNYLINKSSENNLILGLTEPNEKLFKRADDWLKYRLVQGMINETQSLLESGVKRQWLENLGLEYRWTTRFVKKEIGYEEMMIRLKGDIHSYIRRQKTWFKKFPNIELFDISKPYLSGLEKKVISRCTQNDE